MHFRALAAALLFVAVAVPAVAAPSRVIILRHGEKADAWELCGIGNQRAAALAAHYLGKGAAASLFPAGAGPDAIWAITLHTLELVAPAADSWGMPVVTWTALPAGTDGDLATELLNARTQEAVADLLGNPRWNGKTVVMAWEHKHIADAKLDAANPDAPVTLYRLLGLDAFKDVPATWPGDNYDYFWIVDMNPADGKPTSVKLERQVFPAPFEDVPANEWGKPNGMTTASGCKL